MRKQVGASAGSLALLAVLVHTQFGPEPGRSSRDSSGKQVSVSSESTKREGTSKGKPQGVGSPNAEDAVEGPWLAIRKFFGTEGSLNGLEAFGGQSGASNAISTISPATLLPLKETNLDLLRTHLGVPEKYKQSYPVIIATVADPVHTHLALFTDHEIEGILTGLQAAKWEFASQWLPWADSLIAEKDDVTSRRKTRALLRQQENIPGVLIFRRAVRLDVQAPCSLRLDTRTPPNERTALPMFCADTLFVLVVPETPTAGINPTSFNAAVRIAMALRGNPSTRTSKGQTQPQMHQIGLLAPSFSGSFFSLARLINDWKPISNAREALLTRVYTGTAAVLSYAQAFENTTGFKLLGSSASSVDISDAFKSLLKGYGLTPRDVALLSEDETSGGAIWRSGGRSGSFTKVRVG